MSFCNLMIIFGFILDGSVVGEVKVKIEGEEKEKLKVLIVNE